MEPIINPIWFYVISMSDKLEDFILIIAVLSLIAGIISIIIVVFGESETKQEEEIVNKVKNYNKFLLIGVMLSFIFCMIPSKEVYYEMITASMITPNNIETVGNSTKNIVDYIVDSIDKLLEDDK